MAKLFSDYMQDSYYAAYAKGDARVFPLRALPHEGAIEPSQHPEILDYE